MSVYDCVERKQQRFLKDNIIGAVVQVELSLRDYNYKRGRMDCFGAIVAVDFTCNTD